MAGLLLAAVLSPVPAAADPPGVFVVPRPGTTLVWDIQRPGSRETRTNVIDTAQGYRISFLRRGAEEAVWVPFCYACGRFTIEDGKYAALWPLAVGKSGAFQRTRASDGRSWKHAISVVRTEPLTVPAGRFDTFVVEEQVSSTDGGWSARLRYWWAPSVGYIVRQEITEKDKPTEVSIVTAITAP